MDAIILMNYSILLTLRNIDFRVVTELFCSSFQTTTTSTAFTNQKELAYLNYNHQIFFFKYTRYNPNQSNTPRMINLSLAIFLTTILSTHSSDQEHYAKGVILDFKCADKSLRIKKAWVNDDYCDCPDGSDEPHTSACSHLLGIFPDQSILDPTFTCMNLGHIPFTIPSSRVGDGICDCCDGSDERHEYDDAPITKKCNNDCIALGLEIRKKKAKTQLILRQGLRARNNVIATLNSDLFTNLKELKQLEEDLYTIVPLVSLISARKLTEEAIEYKEQVWRAKFLFEKEDDEDEVGSGGSSGSSGHKNNNKNDRNDKKDKMDTIKDNSHAVLGAQPTKEDISKLIKLHETDNTTRIPHGTHAWRLDTLKDMELFMSSPNLLIGIILTDVEEVIPEQRNQVRNCPLSEFLEEVPAEQVTSKDIMGAKATITGGLSLMDLSIALGGIPPEVQGGSDEARFKRKEARNWDPFKDGRRYGFMGPIFNGGRKGWSRGYRYILSGLGLMFSPARVIYETVTVFKNIVFGILRAITPGLVSKPANRSYRKVAKVWWVNVGVKARRVWRRWQGPWAWRAFWNASPELYRYYFPFIDEHHIRPEAEVMRSALNIAQNEKKLVENRIDELHKKITGGAEGNRGPLGIFNGLAEKCVKSTFQGYNYEVCPFRRATQNGNTNLGNWKGFGTYKCTDSDCKQDMKVEEDTVPDKESPLSSYLDWWFVGGQKCHTGPKRRALIHLVCGPEDMLDDVVEPETCMYEMKLRTPVACDPKNLDSEFDMVEEACWNRETARCDSGRL